MPYKKKFIASKADFAFFLFLFISAVIGLLTAFLPFILSLWYQNWWYMSLYYFIMAPLVFEFIIFWIVLQMFD